MRVPSKVTLALALLLVLGLPLVLLRLPGIRPAGEGERSAAALRAPAQAAADSPLPTPAPIHPAEEVVVITPPPPDGGVMVLEPGKVYVFPSPTPFPTWTPRPTPTRRPGPTATPMPLPKPADTTQGYLLYAVPTNDQSGNIWMRSGIDASGKLAPDSSTPLEDVTHQLTFARPSPDGSYILFLQPSTAGGIPYIYESFSQRIRPLFDHPEQIKEYGVDQFDQIIGLPFGWHPDSNHVLFWAWTVPDAGLWLVDVVTGERTVIRLHRDPPPRGAAVSPDGQRVAYAASDEGITHVEIASVNGVSDKNIESIQVGQLFGWSPDGKSLLVSNADRLTSAAIQADTKVEGPLWLLDAETSDLQPLQIPFIASWPFQPSWSPDGRYVAGVGTRPGEHFSCFDKDLPPEKVDSCMYEGSSIYLQDMTNGKVRELTDGILPTWSPDGSMLAFLSGRTGSPEIWTIRPDGTELQQVTSDGKVKRFSLAWIRPEGESK